MGEWTIDIVVKIENLWAIESDKSMYAKALLSAQDKYPTLKFLKAQHLKS